MSKTGEEVRQDVERAYTEAIRRAREGSGGCCGGGGGAEPAGAAAKLAGYDAELQAHREAGASSFGCGNPLAFAGVRGGDTVLDLGSGAGLDLLIAADKVGPDGRVIGIDMTDAMIETARENARRAGLRNIEVRKGLIEELPVEDGSVDWVISNCVINLSPEKDRVFREIHRVLKPGGRFSISDIVVEDLPAWVRELAQAHAACIAGAISEQEYAAGLRGAGLTDVAVTERLVYTADQIRDVAQSDLESLGVDAGALGDRFAQLEGRVRSVRLHGRKPAA
ncbi:MAG: arsenite methyltransferase [Planctomycetota bacterium]